MKFKTCEEIIRHQNAPIHSSAFELKPGKFQLEPQYIDAFRKLFRPAGLMKNVGNGEVAMYWLMSNQFGGKYDVRRQGGTDKADFLVGGKPVEIKGWNVDVLEGQRIKIGRFESIHSLRRMINIIFGAYNVFYAGRYSDEKHGKESYLSESSFGINGLTRAFECALKIKDIELKHLDNIREVLSHEMYHGLEDPRDYAAATFATLAAAKLLKKVGSGNFIVNARPDNIGVIEVLKLGDINSFNFDLIKNEGARVQCSELFVDLTAFQEGENEALEEVQYTLF
jgi:hypothetical protein